MIRLTYLLLLSMIAGVCCVGCGVSPDGQQFEFYEFANPDEANPPFDTYLTFRNYDGFEDSENAVIILGGLEMGKGKAGLVSALNELKIWREEMAHRRVLVYPDLYRQKVSPLMDFPWGSYEWLVRASLKELQISFTFSDKNETGEDVKVK